MLLHLPLHLLDTRLVPAPNHLVVIFSLGEVLYSNSTVQGKIVCPFYTFCGLFAVEEGETPETYPYGITSLADKRDFLQKGDIVNFQVTKVKGSGVLRATNLAAQRKYIRAKVDSVKGQVWLSMSMPLSVCAANKDLNCNRLWVFYSCTIWLQFTLKDLFDYFASNACHDLKGGQGISDVSPLSGI